MAINILAIALVLGALIFFHELGHFLVAKIFRIGVHTFSLGFGPKLCGFSYGQTEYRLSAIPLGGYVNLVGESPEVELPEGFSEKTSFSFRPSWQRMLVVLAGPVFNFLLAWIIYCFIYVAIGQQAFLPQIGKVMDNTPAKEAGLKSGDRIVRINDKEIQYWHQMAKIIHGSQASPLSLMVKRQSELFSVTVDPELEQTENIFGEKVRVARIGIVASKDKVHISMGLFQSMNQALVQTWSMIALTVKGLVKIIERVVPLKTIGGPIMIAQLVSQQTEQGLINVLGLTALISINLGLLNLLPIPVLDGGHILFYGLETIFRRPVDEKWRNIAMRVGVSFIIALMALAVYNDLYRIFSSQ
ncbi:MAG TPA: RIP metalloprotease RseP [Desulfohalobiaceae bacterium]|nr:RIP metalloprotease RseP [Desulfohalobiaceae bacterium]